MEDVVHRHGDGHHGGHRDDLPAVAHRPAEEQQRHGESGKERDATQPRGGLAMDAAVGVGLIDGANGERQTLGHRDQGERHRTRGGKRR
jgi:hypothetical protein